MGVAANDDAAADRDEEEVREMTARRDTQSPGAGESKEIIIDSGKC